MAIYQKINGGIELVPLSFFPNGELKVPNCDTHHLFLRWDSDSDLIHLMLLKEQMRDRVHLTILYMPYSRMDRGPGGNSRCSLRYIGEFLKALDFASIEVIDPHSDLTLAYLGEKAEARYPFFEDFDTLETADVLMFPDAGAQKRYGHSWTGPAVVGNKVRDFETGKITGYTIDNPSAVTDKNVIILDDLCSKGTTFLFAANELRKYSPKSIRLVVTHCESSVFNGELLGPNSPIDEIITTDSMLNGKHAKLTVLSLFEVL